MDTTGGHVAAMLEVSSPRPPTVVADDSTSAGAEAEATRATENLNSRRLTGAYLRFVAKAIDLPTSGSVDETRAMISGKLEQMGRDPRNVQVVVRRDPSGQESLLLVDMDGAFIDAGVMEETARGGAGDRGTERRDEESDSTSSDRGSPTLDERAELRAENAALIARNTALTKDVSYLKEEVAKVNDLRRKDSERVRELWRGNCEQVAGFDQAIAAKDSEIDSLRARVAELEAAAGSVPAATAPTPLRVHCLPASRVGVMPPPSSRVTPLARRGKAPPVNEFSGEDPECLLEDWLPSLERTSLWNTWSEEEQMIQLAGYLRGRALQEWNLLRPDQRATYAQATESLRSRLDSIGRTAAAQDFRHAAQHEEEPVSDFIRRIFIPFCLWPRPDVIRNPGDTPVWPTSGRTTTATHERTSRIWRKKLPGVICCGSE